ncbi:acyltransferase family protein [Pseudomonas sp. PDM20]|uniref:acyltransferase family protein n=1 Tax=Pseudomonas sp. PDM20 TaxID=2769254 RepID=UPI00178371A1|nr:acyltransferase [Pseudomonas sp. PDM20]MBD9681442.1 acyltransferase [Pseudomonas sp. PDM20]
MHKNNFDFVRIVAAGLVLYSHMFGVFGLYEPAPFYYFSYGGVGVLIFFSISGYLVSQSWQRDPHIVGFLTKRILRIFPGLIAASLLMALIVGPLATSLPLRDYFTNKDVWWFIPLTSTLQFPDKLPGVFDGQHYTNINTSLWTIPVEFKWYILTAMLGLAGALRFKKVLLVMLVFMVGYQAIINGLEKRNFLLEFGFFFLSGILLNVYSETIKKHGGLVSAVCVASGIALWQVGQEYLAAVVSIPLITIAVGTASTPFFNKFGRFGDLSYGFYIYAFPVQQLVVHFLNGKIGVYSALALSAAITLTIAFFSWHLVEKPAMRLKRYVERRGRIEVAASEPSVLETTPAQTRTKVY